MHTRTANQNASTVSPRVTVVIPAFNVPPAIVEASIRSIREQTFRDFESIVVDESTNPECAAACKALCEEDSRFIYMRPPIRLGLAGSLNFALEHARGEIVARVDADDICIQDRFARQVEYFDANPSVEVLGGWMEIISDYGESVALRRYPENHRSIVAAMQITNAMAHPTIMFRKVVTESFGSYDANFRLAEDLELWLRWMNSGVIFHNLPLVLVKYRKSLTQRSADNWKYNMRARLRNFSAKHLLRRCVGLLIVGVFPLVHDSIQERIYRLVIFSKNRNKNLV